jgi:hypothetical protein
MTIQNNLTREQIVDKASSLAEDIFHRFSPELRDSLEIQDPVPVTSDLHEKLVLWRVPLAFHGRVIGFVDISSSGSLLRHGLRYCPGDSLENLPPDLLEINPSSILAELPNLNNEYVNIVAPPHIVCLQSEAQLAWKTTVGSSLSPETKDFFVTPGFIWERTSEA